MSEPNAARCEKCGGTGWEATQRLPELLGGPGFVMVPCTNGCDMVVLPNSASAQAWADRRLPQEAP